MRLEMMEMTVERWESSGQCVCRMEGRRRSGGWATIVPIWDRKGAGMCMTQENAGASHYSVKY